MGKFFGKMLGFFLAGFGPRGVSGFRGEGLVLSWAGFGPGHSRERLGAFVGLRAFAERICVFLGVRTLNPKP